MAAGGGDIGLVYIYKAEAEEVFVDEEEREREKRVAPSSKFQHKKRAMIVSPHSHCIRGPVVCADSRQSFAVIYLGH